MRSIGLSLIVARIVEAMSKLAAQRAWHTTTLPGDLGIEDAGR